MSSASGTYVVYLDNIDASAATDIMPGAEFLANAFISYIIWACETKTIKMDEDYQLHWELEIHKYVYDHLMSWQLWTAKASQF